MPLSIPAALTTVASFLSDGRDGLSPSASQCVPPRAAVPDNPLARVLPAFHVTWRGGANIIAPDHGAVFVSADCAWRDRTRLAQEHMASVRRAECQEGTKGKECTEGTEGTEGQEGEEATECTERCGRCCREADAVPSDCAAVPRERDLARAVLEARRDRVRLHRSCRAHHPHGALGLRESPYGHTGEVYDGMQHRLFLAATRSAAQMKRSAPHQGDSLFGSNAMWQPREVRCKGGDPPGDHLFGAVLIDGFM